MLLRVYFSLLGFGCVLAIGGITIMVAIPSPLPSSVLIPYSCVVVVYLISLIVVWFLDAQRAVMEGFEKND